MAPICENSKQKSLVEFHKKAPPLVFDWILSKLLVLILNYRVLMNFDLFIFLIGLHSMQGWTATKQKNTKKITGYRKSI